MEMATTVTLVLHRMVQMEEEMEGTEEDILHIYLLFPKMEILIPLISRAKNGGSVRNTETEREHGTK